MNDSDLAAYLGLQQSWVTRTRAMTVRLTDAGHELLCALAARQHRKPADMARVLIEEGILRERNDARRKEGERVVAKGGFGR